jgi:23S rRNA (adenine2503-C2)-methyltransferase
MQFIRLITNENGLNLSQRHVTISTCGIIPKIKQLEDERIPLTLAVSLHAPNDEIRAKLMPISRKYPISSLIQACRQYANTTKRRVTFEYALIHKINDSSACAKELANRLRGGLFHVNLIPLNPVNQLNFKPSSLGDTTVFANILRKSGIQATVRARKGDDINAACGQLRSLNQHLKTTPLIDE